MKRLAKPRHSMGQAIDACAAGIILDTELRDTVCRERKSLIEHEEQYVKLGTGGLLYTIAPISSHLDDVLVVGDLTKANLKSLYSQFFVPAKKPGRKIYDALMLAASEQCPFCGGIGQPTNLDHFLPKDHFPQYSVLPYNLVPSCRDCNMGAKGAGFATAESNQPIHPYVDKDCFFVDRWITCHYSAVDLHDAGTFIFHVEPPEHWDEVNKARARSHFSDFQIARRYGLQAAELLGTVLAQVRNLRALKISMQEVVEAIIMPAVDEAPFVNHWRTGMHLALAQWLLMPEKSQR